jgi:hypothetical protein
MKTPKNWSIGTVLLWTLVIGLGTSHVVKNWPRKMVPFYEILTKHGELEQLILDLDSTARTWSGGSGTGGGRDTVTAETTFVWETEKSRRERDT